MILIRPRGRLGNQMFQLMLACELRRRAGARVAIAGFDMPQWRLTSPATSPIEKPAVVLKGHVFNLDRVAYLLKTGDLRTAVIGGWGMRLDYYHNPLAYRALFRPINLPEEAVGERRILIHVRAEDILTGRHPKYYPMPFAYYERIVDSTGLAPVFAGQLDPCPYVDALRRRFRGATFLPAASPMEDFQRIRNASHVVLSVSSFSWLAGYFSESAVSIHMPVCGLFDPRNRDTMLLPTDDPRYHFQNVAIPDMQERKGLDVADWAQRALQLDELTGAQARKLVLQNLLLPPGTPLD